jgi:hypothetical protein
MREFVSVRVVIAGIALLACSPLVFSQNPQLQLKTAGQFPTVIFTAVRWNADPSYYSIAIDASGTATYVCAPAGLGATGVPFTTEFRVGDRTRRIVFHVAQELNYFADSYGEQQSSPGKNNVYTAAYKYGSVNNQFTYSTSSDDNLQELTSVFEELSQTFEYGRNLLDARLHNRKAIEPELDEMTTKADRHALRDIAAVAPILRGLASDTDLNAQIRKKASSLIKMAENTNLSAFP